MAHRGMLSEWFLLGPKLAHLIKALIRIVEIRAASAVDDIGDAVHLEALMRV